VILESILPSVPNTSSRDPSGRAGKPARAPARLPKKNGRIRWRIRPSRLGSSTNPHSPLGLAGRASLVCQSGCRLTETPGPSNSNSPPSGLNARPPGRRSRVAWPAPRSAPPASVAVGLRQVLWESSAEVAAPETKTHGRTQHSRSPPRSRIPNGSQASGCPPGPKRPANGPSAGSSRPRRCRSTKVDMHSSPGLTQSHRGRHTPLRRLLHRMHNRQRALPRRDFLLIPRQVSPEQTRPAGQKPNTSIAWVHSFHSIRPTIGPAHAGGWPMEGRLTRGLATAAAVFFCGQRAPVKTLPLIGHLASAGVAFFQLSPRGVWTTSAQEGVSQCFRR
jgi:hypothetical protein